MFTVAVPAVELDVPGSSRGNEAVDELDVSGVVLERRSDRAVEDPVIDVIILVDEDVAPPGAGRDPLREFRRGTRRDPRASETCHGK